MLQNIMPKAKPKVKLNPAYAELEQLVAKWATKNKMGGVETIGALELIKLGFHLKVSLGPLVKMVGMK